MPGTPSASPNFAIPRFSNADAADFAVDVNSVVDAIDANMLGTHWVYRTLASGTGTAVNGDFWLAAGGSTVNLPTPTAGRSVAVQADTSASGSSQVTVSTGSGSIRGIGLGTTTASLKLGTPGAAVLLVADGTNWRILAGQQDTGVTLTSGSLTAKAGQWIVVQAAGVTVTLPAVQAGATIRVTNVNGTPSSPTSVAGAGGALIYGQGTAPAASIVLGQAYSGVTLVCDGTNWAIVAGQQDTGWVAIPLASGVGVSAPAPLARLQGDKISLSGSMQNTSGGTITASTTLATLPVAVRPASNRSCPATVLASVTRVAVLTSGIISLPQANWAASDFLWLDGISFPSS